MMHTFAQWFFFTFGLRRRTAARRTPAMLQVDRSNVVPLRADRNGPQAPCSCRIGIAVRDGGFQYIKPLASEPRTA
jgi:hypothetical protein